jgi:hypothetical protein
MDLTSVAEIPEARTDPRRRGYLAMLHDTLSSALDPPHYRRQQLRMFAVLPDFCTVCDSVTPPANVFNQPHE